MFINCDDITSIRDDIDKLFWGDKPGEGVYTEAEMHKKQWVAVAVVSEIILKKQINFFQSKVQHVVDRVRVSVKISLILLTPTVEIHYIHKFIYLLRASVKTYTMLEDIMPICMAWKMSGKLQINAKYNTEELTLMFYSQNS